MSTQIEQSIQAFALTMNNPAMTAMLGPGYALEDYTKTAGSYIGHRYADSLRQLLLLS
ncbi:MAG: hypothetical protein ACOX2E_08160 [Syntrophaceticus sp.]